MRSRFERHCFAACFFNSFTASLEVQSLSSDCSLAFRVESASLIESGMAPSVAVGNLSQRKVWFIEDCRHPHADISASSLIF